MIEPKVNLIAQTSKVGLAWCYGNALEACPGAVMEGQIDGQGNLVCDSICEQSCYAQKGKFGLPRVERANRFRGWRALQPGFILWFVAAFLRMSGWKQYRTEEAEAGFTHLRQGHTGDFRSIDDITQFGDTVTALRKALAKEGRTLRVWVVTRCYHLGDTWLGALRDLQAIPGVSVTPSALSMNTPAPMIKGLAPGLAVYDKGIEPPSDHTRCAVTYDGVADCHTCGRTCSSPQRKKATAIQKH